MSALCDSHGVELALDPACNGGGALGMVRKARNDLAHGNATFEEVGRGMSLPELERAKSEVVLFLEGLMDAVARHVERRAFLHP